MRPIFVVTVDPALPRYRARRGNLKMVPPRDTGRVAPGAHDRLPSREGIPPSRWPSGSGEGPLRELPSGPWWTFASRELALERAGGSRTPPREVEAFELATALRRSDRVLASIRTRSLQRERARTKRALRHLTRTLQQARRTNGCGPVTDGVYDALESVSHAMKDGRQGEVRTKVARVYRILRDAELPG